VKIHEYQAREIMARAGVPFSRGRVATTPEEVEIIGKEFGVPVVVKAQVHVGGRGKAGGVKIAKSPEEAKQVASQMLGMNLKGLIVKKVLVSECIDIASEAYLGVIVDRKSKRPVMMVSGAGGVEIEEVAKQTPEKIHKLTIDPLFGLRSFEARDLSFKLYSDGAIAAKATKVLQQLYQVFLSCDASLVEINPFVTTPKGEAIALDAKINIDDNALSRRPDIEALRDLEEEVPAEVKARKKDLTFIRLEGNIGCVVNGAGLAMATMDLVKLYGGEPANFLDIGGSSNPEKVTTAMEIILEDQNVKAILFNIFGGITRCDDVANGLVESLSKREVRVPIVIRLAGTNEEKGRQILAKSRIVSAVSMSEAVKKVVALAQEGREAR
jgi:succinyl-CoA synthetase beta subunit